MAEQPTTTVTRTPFEFTGNMVISVNVSDLDRSIEWYRDALGFELDYKLDEYGWCEMKTPLPGISIGLGQTEEQKAGGTTPTFTVKDIYAAKGHLEAHGARFESEPYEIEGMVKLVTFYDLDGNPFMLAQPLKVVDAAR